MADINDQFDEFPGLTRADAQMRSQLRELMQNIQRIHPENCTPTYFAFLQRVSIDILKSYMEMSERLLEAHKILYDYREMNGGGAMPEWPRSLMEELSEGLGDEFKNL